MQTLKNPVWKKMLIKHFLTKTQYHEIIEKIVKDFPQLKSVSYVCFVDVINAVCKPTVTFNLKSTEYLANKLLTFLNKHK